MSPLSLIASSIILLGAAAAHDDAFVAVQVLREGGCGGTLPAAAPVQRDPSLDAVASHWAKGIANPPDTVAGVHLSGAAPSLVDLIRRTSCRIVMQRDYKTIGIYRQNLDAWLIFAPLPTTHPVLPTPRAAPGTATPPMLAARVLQLVNDVRARGARCGEKSFRPAPPVTLSGTLGSVALGHAADMAQRNYFEHEDKNGHSPADRVRAAGYKEKLVGENIAYGPESADEVVQGWLDSPGHCENIMDPRFAEMGVAFAAGQNARRGIYWVQLLVAPKA